MPSHRSPPRATSAREPLRRAAVGIDGSRARDPGETLDLWRALVAGQWVLVEAFDHKDRRYVVARERTSDAPRPFELSQRESQVVAFTALGRPSKHIAYELGLSPSSVATYLRRALDKLGLPDRLSLVQRFSGFAASPSPGEERRRLC